ncbi:MAG TPA: hypothetical protein VNQ90_12705 [Chthoniobacteraceae bacterium]|nr:hypothetical protein [Chthoniobacteraceae bacterium]
MYKKIFASLLSLGIGIGFLQANEVPKDYPLKNCPVSGKPLGSGGMVPYKMTHKGVDVWLCCSHCDKRFLKDADKHVRAVQEAAAAKAD